MPNLLSKDPLITAYGEAEVYVVHQNRDWRMTLATLISLVTKSSLGLEKVDNTSDLEKPVSAAQREAFDLKANKDEVPTLIAFNSLAGQLQNFVTTQMLTAAIDGVMAAQQTFLTETQANAMMEAALSPIVLSLESFNTRISSISDRLTALEEADADDVSSSDLAAAIQGVLTTVTEKDDAIRAEFNQHFTSLDGALITLSETMQSFQLALQQHRHVVADIDDLEPFVDQKITDAKEIFIGANEW